MTSVSLRVTVSLLSSSAEWTRYLPTPTDFQLPCTGLRKRAQLLTTMGVLARFHGCREPRGHWASWAWTGTSRDMAGSGLGETQGPAAQSHSQQCWGIPVGGKHVPGAPSTRGRTAWRQAGAKGQAPASRAAAVQWLSSPGCVVQQAWIWMPAPPAMRSVTLARLLCLPISQLPHL